MAERLPIIKAQPRCIVDWQSFLGASSTLLRARYPQARLLAAESGAQRLQATAAALRPRWWSAERWSGPQPQALPASALAAEVAGQAGLLWANMALHGCAEPAGLFKHWHGLLAVDGFMMFSTLGPGSLLGLSALYRELGLGPALAPFVDMHDLGDMLVQAGFADPVMDQETVTLTWASPAAALAELRTLGGNAARGRHAGWRTPRWRQRLEQAWQGRAGPDGRVALDFEIVYGHAFKPLPRARVAAETQLPLADLRAMVRAGRKTP